MSKNLILIEDDIVIRESLIQYIAETHMMKVVSSYSSVEAFMADIINCDKVDTILLDIGLPGISGIEGIPNILTKCPHADIVMLTTYEETEVIFEAICAGATSYISKRSSLSKIIDALTIVHNGGSYMSPSIARKVFKKLHSPKKKNAIIITPRQEEIVHYIAEGYKYQEIAEKCFVSINTVRSHIKKIYKELKVSNKAELINKYNKGEI